MGEITGALVVKILPTVIEISFGAEVLMFAFICRGYINY